MIEFFDLPEVNSERWLLLSDLEGEIWKRISEFGGNYSISNYGRVMSHARMRDTGNGGRSMTKEHIMRLSLMKQKGGYWYVSIHTKNGGPTHKLFIHRLVAKYFVENKGNMPIVNHKDENTRNNIFYNLEWCDCAYNNAYGTARERSQATRSKKGISKAVGRYDSSGNLQCVFQSLKKAADSVGMPKGTLSYYCRNKKEYNGYLYRYI